MEGRTGQETEVIGFVKHNQMERLTIKELAPYATHGLRIKLPNGKIKKLKSIDFELSILNFGWKDTVYLKDENVLPLLRPIYQLTEEIEHNGSKFTPIYELGELALKKLPEGFDSLEDATKWVSISVYVGTDELMYWIFEWLCEYHFDVFGLIDRGLALPIDGKEVEGE